MQLQEEFNSRWVSISEGLLTNSLKSGRVREESFDSTHAVQLSKISSLENLAQFICLIVVPLVVADKDGDCKAHLNLVQTGEWSEKFIGSSSDTKELEKRDNRCWGESMLTVLCAPLQQVCITFCNRQGRVFIMEVYRQVVPPLQIAQQYSTLLIHGGRREGAAFRARVSIEVAHIIIKGKTAQHCI